MLKSSQQFSLFGLLRLVTISAVVLGCARALGPIGLMRLGLPLLFLLALAAFGSVIFLSLRAVVDFVLRPFFLP